MKRKWVFSISCFCLVIGLLIYSYINIQNRVTRLRMAIPELAKELKKVREQNERLKYQIDMFEGPQNLLVLSQKPEFCHLRQPNVKEIVFVRGESVATAQHTLEKKRAPGITSSITLAAGANP